MELLRVLVAAIAGFAMGAVWYMTLAKPWMQAAGIPMTPEGKPQGDGSPLPFAIAFVAMLMVAGMLRHILTMAAIEGAGKSLLAGLGVGLFFIAPWTAMNYAYAMRPRMLWLIDAGYAVLGCTAIGLVLGLF